LAEKSYRKTMSRAKEHRQAYSAVFVCITSAHEYHLGIKRGYQRSESVSPKYSADIDRKVLIEKEFDLLVWKRRTREVEDGVDTHPSRKPVWDQYHQSITRVSSRYKSRSGCVGDGHWAGGVFSPVGGSAAGEGLVGGWTCALGGVFGDDCHLYGCLK
jgi:hypothetical protein